MLEHLTSWLLGLGTFVALAIFLYSLFDLIRRLLARLALRLCQMRESPEGGFICDLKHRLAGYAEKSLVPRVVVMVGAFAVLAFIVIEHSPRL